MESEEDSQTTPRQTRICLSPPSDAHRARTVALARPSPLLRAALAEVAGARPCHSHPSARTDCGRPSCALVNAFGVGGLSILRNRDPGASTSATLTMLARICSVCDSTKTRRELRFCVVGLRFDPVVSYDSNNLVVQNTRADAVRESAIKEWKGFW